ncbi:MAG: peptidyl-prolyl cis-trans isomerase [Acidobacteriota bacterium]
MGNEQAPENNARGSAVVATPREGAVTRKRVLEWCRLDQRGCAEPRRLFAAAEDLAVRAELSRRFRADRLPAAGPRDPRESEAFERSRAAALDRLAGRLLVEHLRSRAGEPSEGQLRREFEALPARQAEPRWRLRNLFRRSPLGASAAQRAALRREMETLRSEIEGGRSFAEVAKARSDSETRWRGGALGLVTLDRLHPAIAAAVRPLEGGGLSPVVETAEGWTLVEVLEVIQPQETSFATARDKLTTRWRERQIESELKAIDKRAPSGQETEGRAAEARRLGRMKEPAALRRVRHLTQKLEAQRAANLLAGPSVSSPSRAEARAFYENLDDPWTRPRRRRLEALELPIDPAKPSELYRRARAWGQQAAGGALSFEELRERLGGDVSYRGLGWKTDKQLWLLGLNVDRAAQALEVGQSSPWIQEGQTLHLLRLIEIEPEAELSFEQAEERVWATLRRRALQEAGEALRTQVLEQIDFRFARPLPPPAGRGPKKSPPP